ncbi:MAG: ATP-binding protein [Acidobacteriota bacterium]
MKRPQSLREALRNNRVLFGGLSLALVIFTAAYYIVLRGRDIDGGGINARILLFFLRNVNVILVITVAFVLVRNLFKLWLERQDRRLGSSFKSKLVATYIGLSLIPVLLLFAYGTELVQGSIDKLFQTPVDQIEGPGNAVAQALTSEIQSTALRGARRVQSNIEGIDLQDLEQRPRLSRSLQPLLRELELDLLAVYEDTEFIEALLNPRSGISDLPELDRDFLLETVREGSATDVLVLPNRPERWLLAASSADQQDRAEKRLVISGRVLDATLAQQTETLVNAYQVRRQLEAQQEDIRAIYLLLFLMVTLVILLTSSWMGLYLARRITVPIEALAEGTRQITGGDLSHRVAETADDELGVLVDSFNRMTGELEKNKELLERSNDELTLSNQRLDEERALVGAVLQNLAAGVISVGSNGRVFTCNDAALQMLQLGASSLIGKSLRETLEEHGRNGALALFEVDTTSIAPTRREIRTTLAGDWKTFEVKTTPMFDDAGTPNGQVFVLEDLTELIRAQKLATWNEAARRIAHEIKNPLTPIKLSAERLLRKHHFGDPDLAETLETSVSTIVREVDNMKLMVDEFSRFARMPRPQPSTVDLHQLCDDTVKLYRDIKPGLVVRSEVPESGLASKASLDGEQFRSALINLLDNAVAATESPGEIRLSARRSNGILSVAVSDTGQGIAAEDKEKLFLPYYSTKGRGTGLGLAIVHRIVADHHGTIRVEDNPPQGSVFTIEIPQ